jgi:hypothetical protein
MPHSQSYFLFCCFANNPSSVSLKQRLLTPLSDNGLLSKMPIILLLLFFSTGATSQTYKKDRFVVNQGTVVWTEHVEVKDMDTPIIAETFAEHLKSKNFIQLDSLQVPLILSGSLLSPPASSITKARFRIDILYESYIVTVSRIVLENKPIEAILLKDNGNFTDRFPPSIDELDKTVMTLFSIVF